MVTFFCQAGDCNCNIRRKRRESPPKIATLSKPRFFCSYVIG